MGNMAVWKVLEEMVIELRKKPGSIPSKILNDLKSAKVLLEITDREEKKQEETTLKIEHYLENIEIYIFNEIQKKFETKIVKEWLNRLGEARRKIIQIKEENKFISGVPRDQKWIRVKPISELPKEMLEKIAEDENLMVSSYTDGKITIYGEIKNIQKFIKKITNRVSKIQN